MSINFFKSHKIKIHRPIIWAVSLFLLLTITVLLVYADESTYNFVGVTSPSGGDIAYEEYPEDGFSGPTDQGEGEAAQGDYDNIESDNGVRWETAGATSDAEYDSQLYKFFVSEGESGISQLDFKWNGYGETESTYNTTFYAYDYDGAQWVELDEVDFTATTDQDLTHTESSDPGKFIDADGEVTLMAKTKKYVEFCSVPADYKSTKTTEGKIVYCDADGEMWTETQGQYTWGTGAGGLDCTLSDCNDCNGGGDCSNCPACEHCKNLTYAGYDDWYLPTCTDEDSDLPDSCQLYQFGVDNCNWDGGDGGQSSCTPAWDTNAVTTNYWSSTGNSSSSAWRIIFNNGTTAYYFKDRSFDVRCVR